jgi:hypothetical protein
VAPVAELHRVIFKPQHMAFGRRLVLFMTFITVFTAPVRVDHICKRLFLSAQPLLHCPEIAHQQRKRSERKDMKQPAKDKNFYSCFTITHFIICINRNASEYTEKKASPFLKGTILSDAKIRNKF